MPLSSHMSGGDEGMFHLSGKLSGNDLAALLSPSIPYDQAVTLDLGGLTGIDGAGMIALVRLAYLHRVKGAWLTIVACPELSKIIRECGIAALVKLRDTKASGPFAGGEWATDRGPVKASELPVGAGPNVLGRRATGPTEGFGELWLKQYTARCVDSPFEPPEIARVLRERLGSAWPPGNSMLLGRDGIIPGAVGSLALAMPGGGRLHTGVRVVHADELSFTFATLEGHMASGWINFSALGGGKAALFAVESLSRTGDPVFDAGFRLFGHRSQEEFWRTTLERLAQGLGQEVTVATEKVLIDGNLKLGGVLGLAANTILPSMAAEALRRFLPVRSA